MAAVRQMGAGRQRLMGAPAVAEPGTTLVRAAVRTRVPAAVATRTAESVAVRPTLARKTAAIRNLCMALPRPDYLVLYLCDTTVSPLDLYRSLAGELGVKPSHRRAQLWADLKKALVHLVDERGTAPIVVIDEAQHLSDAFLLDLSGFLNFAFDSRDLLTLWLVGLPPLSRRLHMHQHAALATRIAVEVRLDPLEGLRQAVRVCDV